MTVSCLSVQNVVAGYKDVTVIDGVSFNLPVGCVLGLAGLNGQGKTTLIKTLLGLKSVTQGEINFSHSSSNIAYLPERFMPPNVLTGLEFIQFSLRFLSQDVDKGNIFDMADRLSLTKNDLNRKMSGYSKGMKQKVGLLATFLSDTPLIVLDEPMSGLDPLGRRQVKDFIKSSKAKNKSIFMTSHVLFDFTELCDEMLVLHDQKIRFAGTPQSLLDKSAEVNIEDAFLNVINNLK